MHSKLCGRGLELDWGQVTVLHGSGAPTHGAQGPLQRYHIDPGPSAKVAAMEEKVAAVEKNIMVLRGTLDQYAIDIETTRQRSMTLIEVKT